MAHRFTLRIYYSDTDAGGIVYHARYLDFAEHARTELLRVLSKDRPGQADLMREQRVGYVVKSLSVEYHVPAFLDDQLEVLTSLESSKRFSITFLQRVVRAEQEVATLKVRVAAVNLETHRPVPFEHWFSEAVERL